MGLLNLHPALLALSIAVRSRSSSELNTMLTSPPISVYCAPGQQIDRAGDAQAELVRDVVILSFDVVGRLVVLPLPDQADVVVPGVQNSRSSTGYVVPSWMKSTMMLP